MKRLTLPDSVRNIYPNDVKYVSGTPCVLFRDHRWTLPVIFYAAEQGLLRLPATVLTLDRHRDSLLTDERRHALAGLGREAVTAASIVGIVADMLSPRDDDWIPAGMELGFIGDVVQFGSAEESGELPAVTGYRDACGGQHHIFHCHRLMRELSFKGALVDSPNEAAVNELWDVLGWNPRKGEPGVQKNRFVCDIDLDYCTFPWERYVFPFTDEIFRDEFLLPCQSNYADSYSPADFLRRACRYAGVVTIAAEPDFTGSAEASRDILARLNEAVFDGAIDMRIVEVDHPPDYPAM